MANEKQAITQEVVYGNSTIKFHLNFCNRRTLAIHVYPDGSVSVDAPQNAELTHIKQKVVKRARWIRRQQNIFERFPPALPTRNYLAGETFRYLGRQYLLKVVPDLRNIVKLERGYIHAYITRNDPERIKFLVDEWYRNRSHAIFSERFKLCLKLVEKININHDGKYKLRTMKTRWGSCTKQGIITLNPELIAAPKFCIDYVITHELCHLIEPNHSKKFYKLLDCVMPDWEERRNKLNETVELRAL